MKILVVGSGGREHAICWKLAQSKYEPKIYCAPGNAGIASIGTLVPIKAMEIGRMVQFAMDQKMDLVVVGPDEPLAEGMVDAMERAGIRAFGPRANAAILEGSKVFAKNFMKKYGIPTAAYEPFENSDHALAYLRVCTYPIVIKADGLALGKGVVIAQDFREAEDAIIQIMEERKFGASGKRVIIEEFLQGVEVSVLAFTDGKTICPMVSVKDHKRAFENDMGPNTGGMGTISPNPHYTGEIADICMKSIFRPTIEGMRAEGRPFKGVLYFGLMITDKGPLVLEYNARFGDPETQVVLPRLQSDLIDIFNGVVDERLSEVEIQWSKDFATCVVAVSGGYPGPYATGYSIEGIEAALADGVLLFHAGTALEGGQYCTSGGRVLGVVGLGKTMKDASSKAYGAIDKIRFQGIFYRTDIGTAK